MLDAITVRSGSLEFVADLQIDLSRHRIVGTVRDAPITFDARSVAGLRRAFERAVERYLADLPSPVPLSLAEADTIATMRAAEIAAWDREFEHLVSPGVLVVGLVPQSVVVGSDKSEDRAVEEASRTAPRLLGGGSYLAPPKGWMPWKCPADATALDGCIESLSRTPRRGAGRNWIDRDTFGDECPYYAARVGAVRAAEAAARALRHSLQSRTEAKQRLAVDDLEFLRTLGTSAENLAKSAGDFAEIADKIIGRNTLVGLEGSLPAAGSVDGVRRGMDDARQAVDDLAAALAPIPAGVAKIANAVDPRKTAPKTAPRRFVLSLAETFNLLTGVPASPGAQFVQFVEDAADAVGWKLKTGAESPWRSIVVEALKRPLNSRPRQLNAESRKLAESLGEGQGSDP